MTKDDMKKVGYGLLFLAISAVGGVLWAHEGKISKLQERELSNSERLQRIENKVDQVLINQQRDR